MPTQNLFVPRLYVPGLFARRTLLRLFSLLLSGLLAACSGVLDSAKPARQVFLLQPPAVSTVAATHAEKINLILSVKAVPGLDTDRILVLGNDASLNPVSNAHWSDHMPEVFLSISRRYLSDSIPSSVVQEGSIARPSEWLLVLELQAFYGTQGAAGNTSAVVLQLEGLLRCKGAQHVLRIAQESPADGDSLSGLVNAHQRAVDVAMPKLTMEIVKACSNTKES